jgi:hypothetical protein
MALTNDLLTELRQYAIIPESADQAQEVADWLLSQKEKLHVKFEKKDFQQWPIFIFKNKKWDKCGHGFKNLSDYTQVTATSLFAKYRDNQMDEVEYWRKRCELADMVISAGDTAASEEDYIVAQIEAKKAYHEFLNKNPRK